MKIVLLNDNANMPHVGCLGVSDAHARMLGAAGHTVIGRLFAGDGTRFDLGDEERSIGSVLADAGVRAGLDAADAVVLNAEGTIHHGAGLHWLAILGAAQRLGKRTIVVNAVFEESAVFLGVLRRADDVCVRDSRSLAYLGSLNVRARLVHDSILHAEFDAEPTIDLAGKIVVTDWHAKRNADVGRALREVIARRAAEVFYYPLLHGMHWLMWRSAKANWSRARAVVTGRHHGVYLAAMAQVPVVALPSNTHKVEGLVESIGGGIDVCDSYDELERNLERVMADPAANRAATSRLVGAAPLSTFESLGSEAGADSAATVERELRSLATAAKQASAWGVTPAMWPFGLIESLRG